MTLVGVGLRLDVNGELELVESTLSSEDGCFI